ncbi:hypothetical protein KPL76_01560 [Subtercola sp. PAMC28395]|uniref:hypothetical protein n=1 Tax=Subtercola sp. PAMC28395 TaxID=2846775 RepID=UPI001C0B7BB9|nr:hypothetical protein [Subtercola sp. PAMC28395]QWT24148.1 hypothetical protein KPL76_01560 [Subtercola sp. PAMC28395]
MMSGSVFVMNWAILFGSLVVVGLALIVIAVCGLVLSRGRLERGIQSESLGKSPELPGQQPELPGQQPEQSVR